MTRTPTTDVPGPSTPDPSVDIVVVGSGAAGLTAALTAAVAGSSVLLLEASPLIGGTTAFSGGMMWVPNNTHLPERGGTDSTSAALEYIRGLTQGRQYDDELIEVFVDHGPGALDFLEKNSPLRLRASRSYTDYFADRTGGTYGGRSVIPEPIDAGTLLGDRFSTVRDSPISRR
jgi:3-oxosteroid 1-dehydrogenase